MDTTIVRFSTKDRTPDNELFEIRKEREGGVILGRETCLGLVINVIIIRENQTYRGLQSQVPARSKYQRRSGIVL